MWRTQWTKNFFVSLIATIASAALTISSAIYSTTRQSINPCDFLNTSSIKPCVCGQAILDCSRVTSEEQLLAIPGLHSEPGLGFDTITITDNGFLASLPRGAFGSHYATKSYVFARNNQLRSIHEDVFSAASATVTKIVVHENALTSFPFTAIGNFSALESFVAFGNYIRTIPSHAFDSVSQNLHTILLQNNNIQDIGEFAFRGLPRLKALVLERNSLTQLGPGSLHLSTEVASVTLASNSIARVDPLVSGGGIFPPRIVLTRNLLPSLPQEPWERILGELLASEEATYVELSGNPLECNCEVKWLYSRPEFAELIHYTCDDGKWLWDTDESTFDNC
ncbi:unnamed protein product [Notodromas monacha]|uniref:Uncharacterized protein n=1 Tax=Notodromas monacha TaxID=399045 RepID=A0A7R9GGQ4_9CRUS|nr:unnamed protein product [Notodromas monacha]CAG0920127.1 unnamed protein product [Notodromas monacha]